MSPSPIIDRVTAFWKIVRTREFPDLGPGPRPGVLAQRTLTSTLEGLVAEFGLEAGPGDRLVATALLYHDHHDPAHDIVQDLTDADGALIHGILHRREPDYWNAKYWFRRVMDHPIYPALTVRLRDFAGEPLVPALARQLTLSGTIDPYAVVDACEAVAKSPPTALEARFLRRLQHAEFEVLVEHLLA